MMILGVLKVVIRIIVKTHNKNHTKKALERKDNFL
jgi:hypothetical protein